MLISLFQINLKIVLTSYGRLYKNTSYSCYFMIVFIIEVDILKQIFFFPVPFSYCKRDQADTRGSPSYLTLFSGAKVHHLLSYLAAADLIFRVNPTQLRVKENTNNLTYCGLYIKNKLQHSYSPFNTNSCFFFITLFLECKKA